MKKGDKVIVHAGVNEKINDSYEVCFVRNIGDIGAGQVRVLLSNGCVKIFPASILPYTKTIHKYSLARGIMEYNGKTEVLLRETELIQKIRSVMYEQFNERELTEILTYVRKKIKARHVKKSPVKKAIRKSIKK